LAFSELFHASAPKQMNFQKWTLATCADMSSANPKFSGVTFSIFSRHCVSGNHMVKSCPLENGLCWHDLTSNVSPTKGSCA
jgi:hypothetical protein